MRKIIRQIVFSMVLFSTTSHAVASTIQEEIQAQEKRDIKASGSRLGEKIAVGIGICILCYIFYSWRSDTWGLKKYREKRIIRHGASADFVKESGSWMFGAIPKNERYRGVDMSGIGVPDGTSGKGAIMNFDDSKILYFDNKVAPSHSILSITQETTERVKTGDKRNPFRQPFRNLDNGNYLAIDDNNANLSGNEVFVDEPILQQEKAPKVEKQRSSSVMLESAFSKGVSSALKNSKRLSANKEEQAKPKSRPKRNKYKKRPEKAKTRSNSVVPRPAECKGMTKAELSRWAVNKKREELKKMKAKQLQDAKSHKTRTDELNEKRKELNPNATTIRHDVVDEIINNNK